MYVFVCCCILFFYFYLDLSEFGCWISLNKEQQNILVRMLHLKQSQIYNNSDDNSSSSDDIFAQFRKYFHELSEHATCLILNGIPNELKSFFINEDEEYVSFKKIIDLFPHLQELKIDSKHFKIEQFIKYVTKCKHNNLQHIHLIPNGEGNGEHSYDKRMNRKLKYSKASNWVQSNTNGIMKLKKRRFSHTRIATDTQIPFLPFVTLSSVLELDIDDDITSPVHSLHDYSSYTHYGYGHRRSSSTLSVLKQSSSTDINSNHISSHSEHEMQSNKYMIENYDTQVCNLSSPNWKLLRPKRKDEIIKCLKKRLQNRYKYGHKGNCSLNNLKRMKSSLPSTKMRRMRSEGQKQMASSDVLQTSVRRMISVGNKKQQAFDDECERAIIVRLQPMPVRLKSIFCVEKQSSKKRFIFHVSFERVLAIFPRLHSIFIEHTTFNIRYLNEFLLFIREHGRKKKKKRKSLELRYITFHLEKSQEYVRKITKTEQTNKLWMSKKQELKDLGWMYDDKHSQLKKIRKSKDI